MVYTSAVAWFINSDLVDTREFVILSAWIPLLTIPAILLQNKILYRVAVSICFIEGFIGLTHWLILKGPFTVTSLFVLLNTNYHEGMEFMQLKAGWILLLIIPYIALFVLNLKYVPQLDKQKQVKAVMYITLLYSGLFIWENVSGNRLVRKGMPQVAKTLVSYRDEMKMYGAVKNRKPIPVDITSKQDPEQEQVFVLIIGESCNRNHMSLYGHKQATNPRLGSRKDLVVYHDVVSAYSFTIKSVLAMLTESNIENPKPIDQSVSLIDVFRSAGYKTYWISNQSPLGIWDNAVSNLAGTAHEAAYVNTTCNSSEEAVYIPSHDGKLFEPFRKAVFTSDKQKFIVLHLMGNHSFYSRRYPKEFAVFDGGSTSQEIEINEYDNAILYNDFVVDSLLNIIQSYNKVHPKSVCSAIYVADHGENVYDEYGYAGHDYSSVLPNANVEVPFIVWTSSEFNRVNPELTARVKQHAARPFMTDDLFHAVLDLNQLECKHREPERSLFSPTYNCDRKRTPENKGVYRRKS